MNRSKSRTYFYGFLFVVFSTSISKAEISESTLYLLSTQGCGRATAYSEFSKIITIGNKTHVAWLDSEQGKFQVRIRTLDRDSGSWSPTYTVGEAYDNHGGPSLTYDSKGYIHIVYYPHHHPFRHRRSVRPNDASQWTEEIQFGKRCTYPSIVCLPDDTLLLSCRESTSKKWLLNLYRKEPGKDWQDPVTLFHGNAPSGYCRWQGALALGRDGKTVHTSFMIYEGYPKGIGYAICYLKSPDGGVNWQKSDGAKISLPATPGTVEIVAGKSTPTGPVNYRPGNIALDPQGNPWTIYSRQDIHPMKTWIAKSDGKGIWRTIPILPYIQKKWPDRGVKTPGSICFDQEGNLYATVTTIQDSKETKTDNATWWGHPSAEVALLVSDDQGKTFSVYGVSKVDNNTPNWLPHLERPTRSEILTSPSLVYTHGRRGKNNKEILSNDVFWCDITELAAVK
jgi:putative BNR repeat neuraminidase